MFWPVRNKPWPSKNFFSLAGHCVWPSSKNYFEPFNVIYLLYFIHIGKLQLQCSERFIWESTATDKKYWKSHKPSSSLLPIYRGLATQYCCCCYGLLFADLSRIAGDQSLLMKWLKSTRLWENAQLKLFNSLCAFLMSYVHY